MPVSRILIIGGGICGIASAVAICKELSLRPQPTKDIRITIYELRSEPSTIGGAVNLTPSALRGLDILGALDELKERRAGCEIGSIELFSLHTGSSLGSIDYSGKNGIGYSGFRGLRIMRRDLLQALLNVAKKIPEIEIIYDKQLTLLEELGNTVIVKFQDGTEAAGDFVLGCDGIHSATRSAFVEPDRIPVYSGIASAYGFVQATDVLKPDQDLFFSDSALAMSRLGALLVTFCDDQRQQIYLAALMETEEQISKDGWRALGTAQDSVKANIMKRFGSSVLPYIKDFINRTNEWFLYPVFILPPRGKWSTDRVMLLGDAAHAMPPKGESIGYAIEDAVIFSAVLGHLGVERLPSFIFSCYEEIRRKTVDKAYRDAAMGWNSNKDSGYIATKIMEWVTPLYIWWTRKTREAHFNTDPRNIEFPEVD